MIQTYPNPWDFHNTDKTLVSADNYHKVVYYDLNEIAMGSPIGGQCYLENSDKKKIKIHDWCGGPPAWETTGQLIAIPIWTRKFLKGTVQQIGVLDTKKMELRIFRKTFRVIGEVTVWQGHPAEQVKTMKEHLKKLKEQGINSLNDE